MGRREANAVLREFFASTTCHGLQQVDATRKVRAVLWLTAVLATSAFCAYQFAAVYAEVLRHEVTVVPELSGEPVPFPAVTMCNLNPYMASRLGSVPQLKAMEAIAKAITGKGSPEPRTKRAAKQQGRRHKRSATTYDEELELDSRLSLGKHWKAEAGKLKGLGAALQKLVAGHPRAFQLLSKSVLEGRLRHTLASAPPTTENDWARLRAALVYVARLQLRDFSRLPNSFSMSTGSAEILRRAGLPEPRSLAWECGLGLVRSSLLEGRAFGAELQLTWRAERRTRAAKTQRTSHLLLPQPSVPSFRSLGPFAYQEAWNRLSLDLPPEEPLDGIVGQTCYLVMPTPARTCNDTRATACGQGRLARPFTQAILDALAEMGQNISHAGFWIDAAPDPIDAAYFAPIARNDEGRFPLLPLTDFFVIIAHEMKREDLRKADAQIPGQPNDGADAAAWMQVDLDGTKSTGLADAVCSYGGFTVAPCEFVPPPASPDACYFEEVGPGRLVGGHLLAAYNSTEPLEVALGLSEAECQAECAAMPHCAAATHVDNGAQPSHCLLHDQSALSSLASCPSDPQVLNHRALVKRCDGATVNCFKRTAGHSLQGTVLKTLTAAANSCHTIQACEEECKVTRHCSGFFVPRSSGDCALVDAKVKVASAPHDAYTADGGGCPVRRDYQWCTAKYLTGTGKAGMVEQLCLTALDPVGPVTEAAAHCGPSGRIVRLWTQQHLNIANGVLQSVGAGAWLWTAVAQKDGWSGLDGWLNPIGFAPGQAHAPLDLTAPWHTAGGEPTDTVGVEQRAILTENGLIDVSHTEQGQAFCEYLAPVGDLCVYDARDDSLFTGDLLAPDAATGLTEQECWQECEAAAPLCFGVSWGEASGGETECRLHGPALQRHSGTAEPNVAAWPGTTKALTRRCAGITVDQSPTESCEYVVTSGAKISGAAVLLSGSGEGLNASLDTCMDACDFRSLCRGFVFSSALSACQLFEASVGYVVLEDPALDLYERRDAACASTKDTCAWSEEWVPPQADLLALGTKQALIHCADLCRDSPDCVLFVHDDAADDSCVLYGAGGGSVGTSGSAVVYARPSGSCAAPPTPALATNGACLASWPHIILGDACYFTLNGLGQSLEDAQAGCEAQHALLAPVINQSLLVELGGGFGVPLRLALQQRPQRSLPLDDWFWTNTRGNKIPATHPLSWGVNQADDDLELDCFQHWPGVRVGGEALNGAGLGVADVAACQTLCLADDFCAAFEISRKPSGNVEGSPSATNCLLRGLNNGSINTASASTDAYERRWDAEGCWPVDSDNCPARTDSVIHGQECFAPAHSLNHSAAQLFCQSGGGSLAVLDTAEKVQAVVDQGGLGGWLGLQQVSWAFEVDVGWHWRLPNGSSVPAQSLGWEVSEPDDGGLSEVGQENVAIINAAGLYDVPTHNIYTPICSYPLTQTTTSSSTSTTSSSTTSSTSSTTPAATSTTPDCLVGTGPEPMRQSCWAQCSPVVLDGHCFAVYDPGRTWPMGRLECRNRGGHMAVFDSTASLTDYRNAHPAPDQSLGDGWIALDKAAGATQSDWHAVWANSTRTPSRLTASDWRVGYTHLNDSEHLYGILSVQHGLNNLQYSNWRKTICMFPPIATTTTEAAAAKTTTTTPVPTSTAMTTQDPTTIEAATTSSAGVVSSTRGATTTSRPETSSVCPPSAGKFPDRGSCWAQCSPNLVGGWCLTRWEATVSWTQGRAKCQDGGGSLAVFDTNEALTDFRAAHPHPSTAAIGWIALQRPSSSNIWNTVWPDGTHTPSGLNLSVFWNPNQPDGSITLTNNGILTKDGLSDLESHRDHYPICMYPPYADTTTQAATTTVPDPTTTVPVTTPTAAVTTTTVPVATTTVPVTTTIAAVTTTTVPDATTTVPLTTTTAAVTTTTVPVATTTVPVTTTTAAVTTTTVPVATTTVPVTTTTAAATTTTVPVATTTVPVTTTTAAVTTTTVPVATTTVPVTTTTAAVTTTTVPVATTTVPVTTTTAAVTTTTFIVSTTTVPFATTVIPVTTTAAAVTTTKLVASTTTVPVSTTTVPLTTTTAAVSTMTVPVSTTTVLVTSATNPWKTTTVPVSTTAVPITMTTVSVTTSAIMVPKSTVPATSTSGLGLSTAIEPARSTLKPIPVSPTTRKIWWSSSMETSGGSSTSALLSAPSEALSTALLPTPTEPSGSTPPEPPTPKITTLAHTTLNARTIAASMKELRTTTERSASLHSSGTTLLVNTGQENLSTSPQLTSATNERTLTLAADGGTIPHSVADELPTTSRISENILPVDKAATEIDDESSLRTVQPAQGHVTASPSDAPEDTPPSHGPRYASAPGKAWTPLPVDEPTKPLGHTAAPSEHANVLHPSSYSAETSPAPDGAAKNAGNKIADEAVQIEALRGATNLAEIASTPASSQFQENRNATSSESSKDQVGLSRPAPTVPDGGEQGLQLSPLEEEEKATVELGHVVAEVLGDALLGSLGDAFADIPGLGGSRGGQLPGGDSQGADGLGSLDRALGPAPEDASYLGDFEEFPVPGAGPLRTTEAPPPPRPDQSAMVATLKDALPLLVGSLDEAELASVGVTREETFASCHYDRVPCDLGEMKTFLDKRYGNCFVFNWNGTRMVDRSSKDHGFFVQLNVQRGEYMALTESVGMRVALGEPGVVPVPYANGFNVAAGYSNLFQLQYSEVHLAGAPYSDCAASANRSSFLLEGRYSLDGCLESCVQAAVVEQCNCLDPTKPDLHDAHHLKRCDLERKKCLDEFLGSEAALKNAHCAKCLDPCSQGLYQRTQTQVLWPHQKELVSSCTGQYVEGGLDGRAFEQCRQDASDSTVTMWMKMSSIGHRKYREIPKLDGSKVLSTVGGSLGIALGVSALSLVELLLLLCRYARAFLL